MKKIHLYMEKFANFIEIVLAAFISIVIVISMSKLIISETPEILLGEISFGHFLERGMMLAVGIEFVKMLYQRTPQAILEVLMFSISRRLIVEHSASLEIVVGVISIAILFCVRKYMVWEKSDIEKEESEII